MDISKLKVPELRVELGKRGLNTFGTKQILMDRLQEAVNLEAPSDDVTVNEPSETAEVVAKEDDAVIEPVVTQETDDSKVAEPCKPIENGIIEEKPSKDLQKNNESSKKRPISPRRRSRSRDRDSRRSPRRRSRSPRKLMEESPNWESSTAVFLDGYNCDLNLLIDHNGYAAKPQTNGGFSLMWAGVRATYGVTTGKVFYEVRVIKNMNVESLDTLVGGASHVLRVGWSTEQTEFMLGEEEHSYGYGGTAKKSYNNKFDNYGCTFGEGDVVGAFVEFTESEVILRFSVNGVDQGECYRFAKSSLNDQALFPHVYVKNVEFSVNFGQDGQPAWFTPTIPGDDPMEWSLINNVDVSLRVHGRLPPPSKSDCEVLMMVGLPACGKTVYADELRSNNRDKQYTILGTNFVLDKMKVMGLARQRNYKGRWDVLIDKASKCLNILISLACMRRRNYILDQTNVFPSAQRRKMRPFEGFKRKAIVIIPTDEELRRQTAQREKEEGKEVPESAVLEMKANFGIPKPISEDSSSVFDEVIFTRLSGDEAKSLVEKYNEEGLASKPPPQKRQRWDTDSRRDESRSRRGNRDGGGRRSENRRSSNDFDSRRNDYRGGYNVSRDRSRDDDRFERSRDRDYGRDSNSRYGGPNDRWGGSGRGGGFPGSGGYGRFDGPPGNMMRGGPPRGGFGGPGFDGPRSNARGRGGDRGFGGPNDRMYGGRFDDSRNPDMMGNPYCMPGDDANPAQMFDGSMGGYRGGYNANRGGPGFGRGAPSNYGADSMSRGGGFQGRDDMGRGGSSQGRDTSRGGAAPQGGRDASRGGPPQGRGVTSAVRGAPNVRGRGGRGGFQGDRDYGSGFSGRPYGSYGSESYPGGDESFQDSGDRFRGVPYGPPGGKPTQDYANGYPRNTSYPPGYPGHGPVGYPGAPQAPYQDPNAAYPNVQNMYPGADYTAASGKAPTNAANRPGGAPQEANSESLYASGASKISDNRSSAPTQQRQSRFDKSPVNPSFPGGYANADKQKQPLNAAQPGGARSGRSRFDSAPVSVQGAAVSTNQPQQAQGAQRSMQSSAQLQSMPASTTQSQMPQMYGYGYPTTGPKVDGLGNQSMPPNYNAYGYGYGYTGYGQVPLATGAARPGAPNVGSAQSLYASAVSEKPQTTTAIAVSTTTSLTSDPSAAAAAYASYYYGASAGNTAAQQFNAWQQQTTTATSGSAAVGAPLTAAAPPAAAAYAGYYQGYAAYPAGYGAVPVAAAPSGTVPNASASATAQSMPQYYGGYR